MPPVVTLDPSLADLAPTCRIIPHYEDLGAVYVDGTVSGALLTRIRRRAARQEASASSS